MLITMHGKKKKKKVSITVLVPSAAGGRIQKMSNTQEGIYVFCPTEMI